MLEINLRKGSLEKDQLECMKNAVLFIELFMSSVIWQDVNIKRN